MSVDLDCSMAELVLERPSAARVLQRLGLDYCCGGRRSLRETCTDRGLDAETVAVFLEREPEPAALGAAAPERACRAGRLHAR